MLSGLTSATSSDSDNDFLDACRPATLLAELDDDDELPEPDDDDDNDDDENEDDDYDDVMVGYPRKKSYLGVLLRIFRRILIHIYLM